MTCYLQHTKDGETVFLCGDFGPHCAACAACSDYLCDYPVGDGKTCDLPLCGSHAKEVAPNLHYCLGHSSLWEKFRDSGGVETELKNVVPFARQKN